MTIFKKMNQSNNLFQFKMMKRKKKGVTVGALSVEHDSRVVSDSGRSTGLLLSLNSLWRRVTAAAAVVRRRSFNLDHGRIEGLLLLLMLVLLLLLLHKAVATDDASSSSTTYSSSSSSSLHD